MSSSTTPRSSAASLMIYKLKTLTKTPGYQEIVRDFAVHDNVNLLMYQYLSHTIKTFIDKVCVTNGLERNA